MSNCMIEFQTGDIIIKRNLAKGIYIERLNAFVGEDWYSEIGNYVENWNDCEDSEDDIIFAWRPNTGQQCCNNYLWIRKYCPELVLIDKLDPPAKETTLKEIERALGYKIKLVSDNDKN